MAHIRDLETQPAATGPAKRHGHGLDLGSRIDITLLLLSLFLFVISVLGVLPWLLH